MLLTAIQERVPAAHALGATKLRDIDYQDAFEARLPPGDVATVDELARRFFRAQPAWLRALSLQVSRRATLEAALADTLFQPGDRIGNWRVRARNSREIVFGESVGFLTYCFTLSLTPSSSLDRITATTHARFDHPFGRLYFGLIRRMHKVFVRMTLRNTVHHVLGMP